MINIPQRKALISKEKQYLFVGSAIGKSNELITDLLTAASSKEAAIFFIEKFKVKPENMLGPFVQSKRVKTIKEIKSLKFDGKPRQAIYDGWVVNAFSLLEPKDQAFLIFIKLIDDKEKRKPPTGNIVVPITELRFM